MAGKPRPLVDILPAEQDEVFLEDRLHELGRELLSDGAAMLVIHDAARLIQHLPPALPGHVAEVGVFEIEGLEDAVEAAQLEKLRAIEGAATATAVEAGEEIVDCRVD